MKVNREKSSFGVAGAERDRWTLHQVLRPKGAPRILGLSYVDETHDLIVGTSDGKVTIWNPLNSNRPPALLRGQTKSVGKVREVIASAGYVFAVGEDGYLRKWSRETNLGSEVRCHDDEAHAVAYHPALNIVATGGRDAAIRLWDAHSLELRLELRHRSAWINCLAFDKVGERLIAGTEDGDIVAWSNYGTGEHNLVGSHPMWVWGMSVSSDGTLLTGSGDGTIGVWNVEARRAMQVLEGHRDKVSKVHVSANAGTVISGSLDRTARIWDIATGEPLAVLHGHQSSVESVALAADGTIAFTGSDDGTVGVWLRTLPSQGVEVDQPSSETNRTEPPVIKVEPSIARYANAKVILVGESGAGKTSLARRLARDEWSPTEATLGAWATQWKISQEVSAGHTEREVWLWDFGGQADQRLIHQLYFDETAVAVFVFDPQADDAFENLRRWNRDILHAAGTRAFKKILVAGRTDVGNKRFSRNLIGAFAKELGFSEYFETSSKTREGCDDLRTAILQAIAWETLPDRTTEAVFRALQDEILLLRDEGQVLIRLNDLYNTVRARMQNQVFEFEIAELKAALRLLEGPGIVMHLEFDSWVLLNPSLLNIYAQAVVQRLRSNPDELGRIKESDLLDGSVHPGEAYRLVDKEEERFLLLALHHQLSIGAES